jgi:hypothetical protein
MGYELTNGPREDLRTLVEPVYGPLLAVVIALPPQQERAAYATRDVAISAEQGDIRQMAASDGHTSSAHGAQAVRHASTVVSATLATAHFADRVEQT